MIQALRLKQRIAKADTADGKPSFAEPKRSTLGKAKPVFITTEART